MNAADTQIADILARYEEPFAGNVWRVQGTAVIYHRALERIAAAAKIVFDAPQILRAERDEAVILVTGRLPSPGGDRVEWSIGEALVNVNYRVSGKQAAYVYAMAEKRAKDRVILKLIELHGLVYSEEEADEFKEQAAAQAAHAAHNAPAPRAPAKRAPAEEVEPAAEAAEEPQSDNAFDAVVADIRKRVDRAKSFNAVTDVMLHPDTQRALGDLPPGLRDELRDHAKARLVALGWPSKGKKAA